MDQEWSVPAGAVLATLVVLLLCLVVLAAALRRSRAQAVAALASARADATALAALTERVEAVERRTVEVPAGRVDDHEYVITVLGHDEPAAEPAPVVPAPLFTDLVLREGAVQAASLAAGLRRALAPEVRQRIRLEMRREVKRARKQRRADVRQARRDLEARRRAEAA